MEHTWTDKAIHDEVIRWSTHIFGDSWWMKQPVAEELVKRVRDEVTAYYEQRIREIEESHDWNLAHARYPDVD